jgi:hypothetical protein
MFQDLEALESPPGSQHLASPSRCGYTLGDMSIADRLRMEQAERLRQLDTTARIELAFALGRRDISIYAAAHAVPVDEARLRLRTQRKTGRVHSSSAGE